MDSIKRFIRRCTDDQRYTWVAHGLIAAVVPLIVVLAFGMPSWYYVVFVGLFVGFYQWREEADWALHAAKGDLDLALPPHYITPRIDKVGDLVGPYFVFIGALIAHVLAFVSTF